MELQEVIDKYTRLIEDLEQEKKDSTNEKGLFAQIIGVHQKVYQECIEDLEKVKASTSIDEDSLLDNAVALTDLANRISMINATVEILDYQRIREDNFSLHHFVATGKLDLMHDNLRVIAEKIHEVSDDICPD